MSLENKIDKEPVLLSVCMTTYNHENYIAEAIQSVLMQKTGFGLELVIGEDCSTDRTREICKKYESDYPGIVRLILNKKNLGLKHNFFNVGANCKGKYIAYLEGDDYWTDPYKLQKQVDFLEAHDDYALIYSSFDRYDEAQKKLIKHVCANEDDPSFDSLLEEDKIGALTTCYRKSVFDLYVKEVNPLAKNWRTQDYPMWLWISSRYKIHYIPDKTAIFRAVPNSLSNQKDADKYFMFRVSVMDIKYFFAKEQGKEKSLLDEYIPLKKYQLDYAFDIGDKKMFNWAFKDLKTLCPEFLTGRKYFLKMIISNSLFTRLYKIIRTILKRKP